MLRIAKPNQKCKWQAERLSLAATWSRRALGTTTVTAGQWAKGHAAATAEPRPAPTPTFLLWIQALHLPFQHQLPLDHVGRRDKQALWLLVEIRALLSFPEEQQGPRQPGPLTKGRAVRDNSSEKLSLGQASGKKGCRAPGHLCREAARWERVLWS